MKIVIVGANGMLGRDLAMLGQRAGMDIVSLGHDTIDITRPETFDNLPSADWCINCAAYTDVDGAETHTDIATAVNATGAGHLAIWCQTHDVRLLHVSTDYVFDGTARTPYVEDASINPLGSYARSKAEGESLVRVAGPNHVIARTQGLFGRHGKNFVQTILTLLKKGQPLKVVNDQWTCPTYTHDLAKGLLSLCEAGKFGTVHVSSEGECTWYELACFIRDYARRDNPIEPVDTSSYPRPARRPAYSVLDKKRLSEWTGQRLPHWKDAVSSYLRELAGE